MRHRTPSARRMRVLVAVSAVTGLGSLLAAPTAAAPASVVTGRLQLLSLSFDVAANGGIALDLQLPDGVASDPDAHLVITAHRPIESRTQVADAIAGTLPRNADTVDLDVVSLARPAASRVRMLIPVERSTRTADALQLAQPGLYPVSVELTRRGEQIGRAHV